MVGSKARSRRFLVATVSAVALTLVSVGLFTVPAQAKNLHWTHYGVRPLAMGNAYVAVADDFNALFYNPAGLARLDDWHVEVLGLSFGISKNTLSAISDLQDLSGGGAEGTLKVLDFFQDNIGKTHHLSLGLTPHFVMPGFGIGIGLDLGFTMAVHHNITTEIDFGPKAVVPIAFAKNFLDNRLALGAAVKFVARGGIDREFSINDIEAFTKKDDAAGDTGPKLEDYVEGGTGIGADIGLLFTPVKTMEPTIGISITDIGGTPYEKRNISGEALAAPDPRLPSVNTGFSLKPWQYGGMFVRAAVDAHAINHPIHFSKKFNLGLEWGYYSLIRVQTGLYQGELTAGFDFDVKLLKIRFATYAEQLGTYSGQHEDLSDRRYLVQIKLLI